MGMKIERPVSAAQAKKKQEISAVEANQQAVAAMAAQLAALQLQLAAALAPQGGK